MNFWAQNYLIIQTHKLVKNMIMTLKNIKNSAFLVKKKKRLATDWTVRNRTPVEARFSAPVQTGLGASYTMGTGSFPGVKRPGRGVDHPPSSGAKVKERAELYLYSPSGPSWPVLG